MSERRVVLSYLDAPKSLNAAGAGSRAHWSKGHKEKKQWEGIWSMLLLAQKPKIEEGATFCECSAIIRWRTKNRRDVTNFVPALVKPLADVLVYPLCIIPDDTDEFFRFTGLRFEFPDVWEHKDPRCKSETVVTLDLTYR